MPLALCVYTFKEWKSGCALVWMNFIDINYAFLNRLQIGSLWLIAPQKIFWVVSKQLVLNWCFSNGGLRGRCYLITYDAQARGEEEREGTRGIHNDTQLSEAGANLILLLSFKFIYWKYPSSLALTFSTFLLRCHHCWEKRCSESCSDQKNRNWWSL